MTNQPHKIVLPKPHHLQVLPYNDPKRFQIVIAGRRFGKDLSVDTDILTFDKNNNSTNWKKLDDVSVGDYVFDLSGKPVEVTFVSEVFENKPCYEILFSTGEKIICSEDHQWVVKPYSNRKTGDNSLQVISTKELYKQNKRLSNSRNNFLIPKHKPFDTPEVQLPIDPYVFGYHVGDGTVNRNDFTIGDYDIEDVEEIFSQLEGKYHLKKLKTKYRYKSSNMQSKDYDNYFTIGNKKYKFIPREYLHGSFLQRLSLLQGLCDTDGSCSKGKIELSTTSRYLYKQYSYLLNSLGIKFHVSIVESKYRLPDGKYRTTGTNYRFGFSTDLPVFRIRRKTLKQYSVRRSQQSKHIHIISVEKHPSVKTKCISVNSPTSTYLCGKTLIPTHNTELGKLCVARTLFKEAGKVAWFSPIHDMYKDIMRYFQEILQPLLAYSNLQERYFLLTNGASLQFWSAESIQNIRGKNYDLAVLDEASYYKDGGTLWQASIRPTLADRMGRAYFLTTPSGRNYLYELFLSGLDETNPEFKSWQFKSSESPYFSQEEFELAKIYMPERIFRQEYLAEFLVNESEVFKNIDQVCSLPFTEVPEVGSRYVFGVDFARKNDYTVICIYDTERNQIVNYLSINQIKYKTIAEEIRQLNDLWHPDVILAEANSAGDVLIEMLEDMNLPVQGFHTTNTSKERIIQALSLAFEKRTIGIVRDPEVIRQFNAFSVSLTPSGKTKYGGTYGYHDDFVIAAALSLHAAKNTSANVFASGIPVFSS